MNLKKWFISLTLLVICQQSLTAAEKIKIVTSLTDLKSIAELIGGEKVEVFAIAKGFQNPHFVDPKPSYILKLARADLFITVGLDLESSWVPPLLNSARNSKIIPGGAGYIDASRNVHLLQVPLNVDRSEGDIHIYGNPHYWLSPENGKSIAETIYQFLAKVSPQDQSYFLKSYQLFIKTLDEKYSGWLKKLESYKGEKVIAYHNEWPYFEKSFGLVIVDFLEPKPGIPPTPSQLAKIISLMKDQSISIIINSPYFQSESAELVARETGASLAVLATSVEAFDTIESYYDLFDYNIEQLLKALK